jgi:hypothetical protein
MEFDMSELSNKLKQLIKATPGILLVRLADLADCDVDAVHVELADDIRRGEVLSEKTDGPNGLKTQAFRLNPTFLGWGAPPPAARFGCSLAPISLDTTDTTPAQPVESKVQKAIAHLEMHSSATAAALRVVMGLDDKHSPQSYLSYPIKMGRIVRDGDTYRLGSNHGVKRPRRINAAPAMAIDAPPATPGGAEGMPKKPADGWERAILDGYTAGKKPTYDELEAALLGALMQRNAAKNTVTAIAQSLADIVVARLNGDTLRVLAVIDAEIAKSVKIVARPSGTLQ